MQSKRNLNAWQAAEYIGISKSLFMLVYAHKLLAPVPMPGVNGTIRTLLFDKQDIDDLIDAIKTKGTICRNETGKEQERSLSRKDTGTGTSDSSGKDGRIASSAPKQRTKQKQKESVDDTLRRWKGGRALTRTA